MGVDLERFPVAPAGEGFVCVGSLTERKNVAPPRERVRAARRGDADVRRRRPAPPAARGPAGDHGHRRRAARRDPGPDRGRARALRAEPRRALRPGDPRGPCHRPPGRRDEDRRAGRVRPARRRRARRPRQRGRHPRRPAPRGRAPVPERRRPRGSRRARREAAGGEGRGDPGEGRRSGPLRIEASRSRVPSRPSGSAPVPRAVAGAVRSGLSRDPPPTSLRMPFEVVLEVHVALDRRPRRPSSRGSRRPAGRGCRSRSPSTCCRPARCRTTGPG